MRPTITKKAESYSNIGNVIVDYIIKFNWGVNGIDSLIMNSGETLLIKSFYVMDIDFETVRDKILYTKIAGREFENSLAFSYFTYIPEKKIWEYKLESPVPIGQLVNYTFKFPSEDKPTKKFTLFVRGVLTRVI